MAAAKRKGTKPVAPVRTGKSPEASKPVRKRAEKAPEEAKIEPGRALEAEVEAKAPEVDAEAVRALLEESIQLHRSVRATKTGRPAGWKETLRRAGELRRQAIEADPERTAPVWGDEQVETTSGRDTHQLLTKFYESI